MMIVVIIVNTTIIFTITLRSPHAYSLAASRNRQDTSRATSRRSLALSSGKYADRADRAPTPARPRGGGGDGDDEEDN